MGNREKVMHMRVLLNDKLFTLLGSSMAFILLLFFWGSSMALSRSEDSVIVFGPCCFVWTVTRGVIAA